MHDPPSSRRALSSSVVLGVAIAAVTSALSPAAAAAPDYAHPRRPGEVFVVLGAGNAVCDKNKPASQCVVDGGVAFGLGADYRFHPHFAVGGELAFWGYKVSDQWRGTLTDPATEVKFSSFYVAPFMRWYWFGHGITDAYLQAGVGFGSFSGTASNPNGKYQLDIRGVVYPVAIGAEWYVSTRFRLGIQALAYLQKSSTVCETTNGGENCRAATSDQNALPWRLVAAATFSFGNP